MIGNWLLSILNWFDSIWNDLSKEKKEMIINTMIVVFEEVFKNYYKENKNEGTKNV